MSFVWHFQLKTWRNLETTSKFIIDEPMQMKNDAWSEDASSFAKLEILDNSIIIIIIIIMF